MKSIVKKPAKKPLGWFIGNIGKDIVLNNTLNLFSPPIRIADERHAKALHAHQDKGHRYTNKTK